MFEELYEPLPDLDLYLERIGLPGLPRRGDKETLDRILYAHVHAIPFENLDAWDRGAVPSLGVRDLFEKMVLRRRGGWCHEQNALLHAVLEAMGYEVYSIGGRVTAGIDFVAPVGHHAVIAVIDGKKYYCDVGFGDIAFQSSIPLDGTPTAFGFHIEKPGVWYEIWRDWGKEPMKMVKFPDIAFDQVDYLFANQVNATDPKEKFRQEPYLSIMDGDTRKLLLGNTLTAQTGAEKRIVAQPATREEMAAVLKEHFGMDYMPEHEPTYVPAAE